MPVLPAMGSRSSRDGPLGEDTHALAGRSASTAASRRRSGGCGRLARTGIWCNPRSTGASSRLVEQLGLGQEPHLTVPAIGEVREHERIEVGDVIAREDHRAAHGDQVRALDRPAKTMVQHREQRRRAQRRTAAPRPVAYAASWSTSPDATRSRRGSSYRSGRSRSARRASPTELDDRDRADARSAPRRPVSSAAAGADAGGRRHERTRGPRLGLERGLDRRRRSRALSTRRGRGRARPPAAISGTAPCVVAHADLPRATDARARSPATPRARSWRWCRATATTARRCSPYRATRRSDSRTDRVRSGTMRPRPAGSVSGCGSSATADLAFDVDVPADLAALDADLLGATALPTAEPVELVAPVDA